MSVKVYKPTDFPKPKADQYREELFEKVATAINDGKYTRLDDSIMLEISDSTKYITENLLDFSSRYATLGGWHKVETLRNRSFNTIKVNLFF